MKVLFLNYEYPPLGGGAGNATKYILKQFEKFPDLQVDLITSSVDKERIEHLSDNIRIFYLDINKEGNIHYQSNKDLAKYSYKAYYFAKKLNQKQKYDLVHAFFGIPSGFIAYQLRLPYIVSLRGSDVPFYNQRFYWLDRLLFKNLSGRIWKDSKAVISNSQGLKDLAQESFPNQKIGVIYNGIDTQEFFPSQTNGNNSETTILSVGRLIGRKGYHYLIKALANIPQVKLVIAGDGPQKDELKELATKMNVSVDFKGSVPHNKMVELYQSADIFVLPSLNEGMSNAILEAMACGLPIITTDTGGADELISNNGFIVSRGKVKPLREKINQYLNNKKLIAQHGKKSREKAESMSWKKVASQYLDIYHQCQK